VHPWLAWVVGALLLPALEQDGIGSRTTSGYGRLRPAGAGSALGAGEQLGPKALMVTRTRNDGAFHVTLPEGRTAQLRGGPPRAAHQALSDPIRKRLDRNKPVRLLVTWRVSGNARIVESVVEE